jgi:hypothetical protein
MVWLDANLHLYFKARVSFFCDLEDSFWRLFMDTWLRGIVTGSDSWLLIITTYMGAWIFDKLITMVVAPVVGTIYAIFATIARELELKLQKFLIARSQEFDDPLEIENVLKQIQDFVETVSLTRRIQLKGKNVPPPITHLRIRPKTDTIEHAKYLWKRAFRLLAYNQAVAAAACRWLLANSIYVAAGIRVFCMLIGRTPFLLLARLLGLGGIARRHQAWFLQHTGIPALSQNSSYWSDWFFMKTVGSLFSRIPSWGGHARDISIGIVDGVSRAAWPLLTKLVIPGLLVLAGFVFFKRRIKKERDQFKKKWEVQTRSQIWGSCARDNPCGGIEWKALRFSESEHLENE